MQNRLIISVQNLNLSAIVTGFKIFLLISGVTSVVKSYSKAIFCCISFVCCFLVWPIAVLFIKYYNDGKYYLAKGQKISKTIFLGFNSFKKQTKMYLLVGLPLRWVRLKKDKGTLL